MTAVLSLALLGGVIIGVLLRTVIERGLNDFWIGVLIVAVAGLDAALAPRFTEWADSVLGINIEIDSLLIAMVAGVIVVNWTSAPERFERILERMVPYVYVIFFTLTGLGLHLDAIVAAAGAAAVLWVLRLSGLFVGSTAAMTIVKEPAVVRRVAWRAYMPQAGIALALAATIASDFPEGGEQLSTIIIAVVVLNEASGPFFLRSALRATGEAPVETGAPRLTELDARSRVRAAIPSSSGSGAARAESAIACSWARTVAGLRRSSDTGMCSTT